MDQVHVIRHKVLVEGRSARQVATELGISRRTVRKYLTEAVPIRKEAPPRLRPVWETVRERVETVLVESGQWTGGKQRLTATRLHELLVAEGPAHPAVEAKRNSFIQPSLSHADSFNSHVTEKPC